jgi:hypothetical protein
VLQHPATSNTRTVAPRHVIIATTEFRSPIRFAPAAADCGANTVARSIGASRRWLRGKHPRSTARAALGAGNRGKAARLLIDVLDRFPRHLGARTLLHQIRSAENQAMAAEALLTRIVRLYPNV